MFDSVSLTTTFTTNYKFGKIIAHYLFVQAKILAQWDRNLYSFLQRLFSGFKKNKKCRKNKKVTLSRCHTQILSYND